MHAIASFYRSSSGAEIDLVLEAPGRKLAVEIKKSMTPKVSKGFYHGTEDIKATEKFVVYNGEERFQLNAGITAISLADMCQIIARL